MEWPLLEGEQDLIAQMTAPSAEVTRAVQQLQGDVLVLGVGGKMGPTLAELLVRAGARRVIGVSRFSDSVQEEYLRSVGVEAVRADLLDEEVLRRLPDAPYVYLLAGFKFGAAANEPLTWAMNAYLPGRLLQRYAGSRIVYVSSGNVYAFTPVAGGGATEEGEVAPVGEYAQSRLGGERIAENFCRQQGTPLAIARLFYATELRYGIIHDIAWKVHRGLPVDLAMGHVNQIWQGDANAYLARLFPSCTSPATVLNLTGAEVLSVRWIATRVGEELGREPVFAGAEAETALLGNASLLLQLLGPPAVPPEQIIHWMAHWVRRGGRSLGKPTKYESRTGTF
ncbi:MAG: NAD(P)-dependent oxidoreductase [Candidatus Latescibacterota bacterium]